MDDEEWGYQASYAKLSSISESKNHAVKMAKKLPPSKRLFYQTVMEADASTGGKMTQMMSMMDANLVGHFKTFSN